MNRRTSRLNFTLNVVVVFFQYNLNIIQATVKFKNLCRATNGPAGFCIPYFRVYDQFGI